MRALVVGYGRMGHFHANVLREIGHDVTTVDHDPASGADLNKIPRGEMMGRPRYQIACVATPIHDLPGTAAKVSVMTAPDFMLVEKPFAPTSALARQLRAALNARVEHVCVGYVERFNPQIQALKTRIEDRDVQAAEFTRWNTRPSADIDLDLRSHDLDLGHHLGIGVCLTSTRAGADSVVRTVRVTGEGWAETVDLTAHTGNPLREMWNAFLAGQEGCATPDDAVRVLEKLELTQLAAAA